MPNEDRNQPASPRIGQAFMPVLIISNFNDESIKQERASMETYCPVKMESLSSA